MAMATDHKPVAHRKSPNLVKARFRKGLGHVGGIQAQPQVAHAFPHGLLVVRG